MNAIATSCCAGDVIFRAVADEKGGGHPDKSFRVVSLVISNLVVVHIF